MYTTLRDISSGIKPKKAHPSNKRGRETINRLCKTICPYELLCQVLPPLLGRRYLIRLGMILVGFQK